MLRLTLLLFKNHINYIEDHNTVINGLTFAFFGLTEIIIKRVYLTFELNNTIHTIERVYQSEDVFFDVMI